MKSLREFVLYGKLFNLCKQLSVCFETAADMLGNSPGKDRVEIYQLMFAEDTEKRIELFEEEYKKLKTILGDENKHENIDC